MNAPHPHLELMKLFVKDAEESNTPHLFWEMYYEGSWRSCGTAPQWFPDIQYRRKPDPICKIEDKGVFEGDKLWHTMRKEFVTVVGKSAGKAELCCEIEKGRVLHLSKAFLTWNVPVPTKELYQWAYKNHLNQWVISCYLCETEEEVRGIMEKFIPKDAPVKRLDYTKVEVQE